MVPRVMPRTVPRARRVPVRGAEAGERRDEDDAAAVRHLPGQALDLLADPISCSPSRSHCTAAPATKTAPSSAYSAVPSGCIHATVVSSRSDSTGVLPVLTRTNEPVP